MCVSVGFFLKFVIILFRMWGPNNDKASFQDLISQNKAKKKQKKK